jgi:hypothetical protein
MDFRAHSLIHGDEGFDFVLGFPADGGELSVGVRANLRDHRPRERFVEGEGFAAARALNVEFLRHVLCPEYRYFQLEKIGVTYPPLLLEGQLLSCCRAFVGSGWDGGGWSSPFRDLPVTLPACAFLGPKIRFVYLCFIIPTLSTFNG